MTEQEWMSSDEPRRMLGIFQDTPGYGWSHARKAQFTISDRKLSLWVEAAGCQECEKYTQGMTPAKAADYVAGASCRTIAEKANLLREIVGNPFRPVTLWADDQPPPVGFVAATIVQLAQAAYKERPGRECKNCHKGYTYQPPPGLHIGEEFYQPSKCPVCHGTGRIDDGSLDPLRLAILADALEEAGCTDEAILRHLRGKEYNLYAPTGHCRQGPHVRGCWALDLLLGRE